MKGEGRQPSSIATRKKGSQKSGAWRFKVANLIRTFHKPYACFKWTEQTRRCLHYRFNNDNLMFGYFGKQFRYWSLSMSSREHKEEQVESGQDQNGSFQATYLASESTEEINNNN